jgi:hypothetical protein
MNNNQILSDRYIIPQNHCTIHKYFHEIKIKISAFIINNPKLFTHLGLPFFLMNLSMFNGQIPRPHVYMNNVVMNLSAILNIDKESLVWQHHETMAWIFNARMSSEIDDDYVN